MSNTKSRTPPSIIFLHNLKTGGMTFRNVMDRQYKPSEVYTFRGVADAPDGLEAVAGLDTRQIRVIQGHMPFGAHRLLRGESTYATLLRDPVDRVVSLYYFLLQGRIARMREKVGSNICSLERFVERGEVLEVDNGQTRRISGLNPPFGKCAYAMLDVAKENIRERFSAVGLTERFDESLVLFKRKFGWRSVVYLKNNITKSKPADELIPEAARRAIERYNELDLELYAYADDLLRQSIVRQGPEFEAEVGALKILNEACARRTGARRKAPASEQAMAESLDVAVERRADLGEALLDAHAYLLRREAELRKEIDRLEDQRAKQAKAKQAKRKTRVRRMLAWLPGRTRLMRSGDLRFARELVVQLTTRSGR